MSTGGWQTSQGKYLRGLNRKGIRHADIRSNRSKSPDWSPRDEVGVPGAVRHGHGRTIMERTMGQSFVYAQRPQRVYWEITRACDLACRHCRAQAVPDADPAELTTAEGRRLLERVIAFGEPFLHVVFTRGAP